MPFIDTAVKQWLSQRKTIAGILRRTAKRVEPQEQPAKPSGRQYPLTWDVSAYKSWGNNIQLLGHDNTGVQYRWTGWTTPVPQVGDIFETKQKSSGNILSFKVTEFRRCRDPHDMWFATTSSEPEAVR